MKTTKAHPDQGGCWFCHTITENMHFSREFDTYLHLSCLEKEIGLQAHGIHNEEAEIIGKELGLIKQ